MNTSDLPNEILELKKDLKQRVDAFNKKTGLNISEVGIIALMSQQISDQPPIVKGYEVAVNIEM